MPQQTAALHLRRRRWLARQRGNLSLLIAGGGWLGLTLALHYGLWQGPAAVLLRQMFEGAMVGGVADWFAVRALFRTIPIPLLRRHTNIISRSRPRLTEGIVDMVQNQWLAPAVIRERLSHVSLSEMALRHLETPQAKRRLLAYARTLLQHLTRHMDNPVLVRFLGGLAKRHLRNLDLDALVLKPLAAGLRRDELFDRVWAVLAGYLRSVLKDEEVRELLYGNLEKLIAHYVHEEQDKGVISGTWAKLKLWVGLPRKDERRAWLMEKLEQVDDYLLQQTEGEVGSLRDLVRDRVLHLLAQLEAPDSPLAGLLARQRERLLDRLGESGLIERLLGFVRNQCLEQLHDEDSGLSAWLSDMFDDALRTVRERPELRARIDAAVSDLLVSLIEQNPDAIGATVRYALSPERLSDAALIRQIEDKVGDDLEWIRLNGAVVGGLVAGLLGVAHYWL